MMVVSLVTGIGHGGGPAEIEMLRLNTEFHTRQRWFARTGSKELPSEVHFSKKKKSYYIGTITSQISIFTIFNEITLKIQGLLSKLV